jgi:peptidyl-prolyl cis-trans isomerase B (cyclophilin B)
MATDRLEIKKVTIRERAPSVEQMKAMSVLIETSAGSIKLQLLPETAPTTVRSYVRNVKAGLYDGTSFYRVSQKYYMEAGNLGDWPQDSSNRKRFFSLWPTPFEKSDVKHVRGTVSMRQIEPGSLKWYFFVISQDNPALDGRHVPFAKVVEGLDVVDKIAETEVDGDKPKQPIVIKRISVQ